MPIKASIIFEMFPFCILYNVRWCIELCSRLLPCCYVQNNMEVTILGVALRQILSQTIGQGLSSYWELVKPLVEFKWEVRLNVLYGVIMNIINIIAGHPVQTELHV